jgi:putative redox protein
MKARIKWVEDRTFIGESGSGHKIVLGTAFGPEGRSPGPSPMELVLIGLGGCSGYDVVHILEKGREAPRMSPSSLKPSAHNRIRRYLAAFTCIS